MDKTLAEERAEREGLPVVLMTNFDLLHIAGGNPMIVGTADGGEALVRLYTVDELLAAAERAGAKLEAQGLPPGPGMTRADAERLSAALPI